MSEPSCRLTADLWAFHENRVALRHSYERHDGSGRWFRSYGNEDREFDEHGPTQRRFACTNNLPGDEADASPPGPFSAAPTIIRD